MSAPKPLVLAIEDQSGIRRFLRTTLEAHDYRFAEAEDGKRGILDAAMMKPDLVILDLGLPDMDGVEVVKRLRDWASFPIIVLSARSREADKVAALDAGADDYLTKPFAVGELLARLRVALRHAAGNSNPAHEVSFGEVTIDFARRVVTREGEEVHLTPIEYRLLSVLARHGGKVITQGQLLKEVWGPSHIDHAHYLRVYMGNLRQKLEADPAKPRYFLTEPGVGYRLAI
ncbi:MAG: two-component system response regulator KdpE [Burkholderiales bacterium]